MSDRVMMNVFSVLKSRTSTAGFSGVIIVDSSCTGVEMSTNGNAGGTGPRLQEPGHVHHHALGRHAGAELAPTADASSRAINFAL